MLVCSNARDILFFKNSCEGKNIYSVAGSCKMGKESFSSPSRQKLSTSARTLFVGGNVGGMEEMLQRSPLTSKG